MTSHTRSLPRPLPIVLVTCLLWITATTTTGFAQEPTRSALTTRWAEDVDADAPHPEYPRPQLVRDDWRNLNGVWEFALLPAEAERPENFDDRIVVPFPVESALSGVERPGTDKGLWYRRTFELPDGWRDGRVLLHFGAVDWQAHVWVNGRPVGEHRGGYDPFRFDVTDALVPDATQEIVVRAWDPSDAGGQPRGKQVRRPQGIWYTPSSGIWQTVWIEPVPALRIDDLRLVPRVDDSELIVSATLAGGDPADHRLEATLFDDDAPVASATTDDYGAAPDTATATLRLHLENARLWSPNDPHLYDVRIRLLRGEEVVDEVTSYAAMRSVSLGTDPNGDTRILLNGAPLFQFGLLDQGFWPDGLYTAPTDEALRSDLQAAKDLGFNMIRKHVKVEPARWYTWADRLGLLVWQDMPNGGPHVAWGDGDLDRDPEAAAQFERELARMIDALENHPSVVTWVLFNEGWGQYDTERLTKWLQARDPDRLVDSASGWNDRGVGDLVDIHAYPGPDAPAQETRRAAVLGEFGGLGLAIPGTTWQDDANWGYEGFDDPEAWFAAYRELLHEVRALQETRGLAAAVYTQTTDVETEVNGLLSYDRSQLKWDEAELRATARVLARPVPRERVLVPTSEDPGGEGTSWRYTFDAPGDDWVLPGFDDGDWEIGRGGFGRAESAGAVVRTEWTARDIWLRTTFTYDGEGDASLRLRVHHDEDIDVYLNGERVVGLPYYTYDYVDVPLDAGAAALLRTGENTLAAHCRRLGPGQYCDLGLSASMTHPTEAP